MFRNIIGPIHVLVSQMFDSNIIYVDGGERKILIDTGTGMYISELMKALDGLDVGLEDITDIILTHSHIDHIGGVLPILKEAEARVYLHMEEADRLNNGDMQLTLAQSFGVDLPGLRIDVPLDEGQVLNLGDVRMTVLHTPGHSIGSICLMIEDLDTLITGDTMFAGGSFGRVDFPTGDPRALVESLGRIAALDFSIAIPGHMSPVMHDAKRAAMLSHDMARSMFRV